MPRPRRIQEAGHVFHLISRGNNKQVIFRDRADKLFFCAHAELARRTSPIRIFNYSLMDNHIHLLVESMAYGAVCGFMHQLLGTYAKQFNRKYDHAGHVFQGRYKSFLIQTEIYFLRCLRYIDRNAPKAGVVGAPEHFEFNAHRSLAFGRSVPLKIDLHNLYDSLAPSLLKRRQAYRDFVFSRDDSDFDLMNRRQAILGERDFRRNFQ